MDRGNLQQDRHAGHRRFVVVSRTIPAQRALGVSARKHFVTKHAMPCLGPKPCRSGNGTGLRSSSRPPEQEDGCTEVEACVRCGQDAQLQEQPQEACRHFSSSSAAMRARPCACVYPYIIASSGCLV